MSTLLVTAVPHGPGFTVPVVQAVVISLLGVLAGVVAARRPARRAARLPILEAIGAT